jgi:hypothetical protein
VLVRLGEVLQDERGEAQDHREEVVEVVGHPARQPPDGLHLLGQAQGVLRLALLGEVGEDPDVAHRAAAVPLQRAAGVADDADRPRPVHHPQLLGQALRSSAPVRHLVAVLGVHQHLQGLPEDVLGGVAQVGHRGADVFQAPGGIDGVDDVLQVLDQGAVAGLAGREAGLGSLAPHGVGDEVGEGAQGGGVARGVVRGLVAHPHQRHHLLTPQDRHHQLPRPGRGLGRQRVAARAVGVVADHRATAARRLGPHLCVHQAALAPLGPHRAGGPSRPRLELERAPRLIDEVEEPEPALGEALGRLQRELEHVVQAPRRGQAGEVHVGLEERLGAAGRWQLSLHEGVGQGLGERRPELHQRGLGRGLRGPGDVEDAHGAAVGPQGPRRGAGLDGPRVCVCARVDAGRCEAQLLGQASAGRGHVGRPVSPAPEQALQSDEGGERAGG